MNGGSHTDEEVQPSITFMGIPTTSKRFKRQCAADREIPIDYAYGKKKLKAITRFGQAGCVDSTIIMTAKSPNSVRSKNFRNVVLPAAVANHEDPLSCLPQMKRLKVMELALCRGMCHIHVFKGINLLHLRYLVINQKIPLPVLAYLANLEVLRIDNESVIDVSMIISKIVKLRHLHVKYAAFFTNCNITKPSHLRSLSNVYICNIDDYENLSSLPCLKKLKCLNLPLIPDLCFLTELESLKIGVSTYLANVIQKINFPSTVKKLNLSGTQLPWETMSVLGKLPELQSLKLFWDAFKWKVWTTSDDEFQKLKFLELGKLELEQWITMSEHFPRLCHLVIVSCNKLRNFPAELGDIPTMHTIEVHECSYEATIPAFSVEQEQRDNGNEDLQVIITNGRWSKEELALKYKQMNEEQFSNKTQRTSVVHNEVLCDYCGMNPIVGERYKCKDCMENIGYDLCGHCYSSSSRYKLPGRYNQKHTSDHKFEIVTSNVDH